MLFASDRALLQRFREGERDAMTSVYEHYSAPLARYLASGFNFTSEGRHLRFEGLRQRYELHDVLAETFRRAFEERARLAYDGIQPFETYLRAIARHLVIDRLRAQKAFAACEEVDRATGGAGPSERSVAAPDRAYEHAELANLLEQFLAGLPRKERRFVQLRYREAMAQEEVARVMGVSRRWVRSAEESVRRKLVREMKGSGYLPRPKRGEVRT